MADKINVKVKRLSDDAVIPQYATEGSAGFDLIAIEDVIIEPGETKLVPTGLAFEIPQGYEIQIRPRSGVSLKTALRVVNSPATIDSDFRGEVKVIIENTSDNSDNFVDFTEGLINGNYLVAVNDNWDMKEVGADFFCVRPCVPYLIRKGDRIAQGVLQRVPIANFIEVDELDETERGAGGFGSTGVNMKEVE